MRTVRLSTDLPTDADAVWQAMQHPASFSYVLRGLIGLPALNGRTEPMRVGEHGTGWMFLFHLIPFTRHTIHLVEVDADERILRSNEHGGVIRTWNHTLQVAPTGAHACRYTDSIDIEAGRLTGVVSALAVGIFRYRQRRWHKLVRKHLLPGGPAYAR